MPSLKAQTVRTHLQARIHIANDPGESTDVVSQTDFHLGTGRLQSFDADHDFGVQPVHGVGDYIATEFVALKFQGSITMDAFAVNTNDMVDLGISALGLQILEIGLLTITIYKAASTPPYDPDSTGAVLRIYHDCTISRYRESIREGAICGENATILFRYATGQGSSAGSTPGEPYRG